MMTEFFQRRKMLMSSVMLPVGTVWIFDTVGSTQWDCPVAGNYQIEIHGGGGGGGAHLYKEESWNASYGVGSGTVHSNGGGGGGSGQLETRALPAGKYSITVGAGGTGGALITMKEGTEVTSNGRTKYERPDEMSAPTDGSASSISGNGISISVEGGKAGGQSYNTQALGGDGYGNIASSGDDGSGESAAGGYGSYVPTTWDGTSEGGLGNTQKPDQTYGNGGDGSVDSSVPNYGNNGSDGAVIITYLGK